MRILLVIGALVLAGCGPTARPSPKAQPKTSACPAEGEQRLATDQRDRVCSDTDYRGRIFAYAHDLSALEDIRQATHELSVYLQAIRDNETPPPAMCQHFAAAVESGLARFTADIPRLVKREDLETIHPQKRLARLLGKVGNRICVLERGKGAPRLGPVDKIERLNRALRLDVEAHGEESARQWAKAQKLRLQSGMIRAVVSGRTSLHGTAAETELLQRTQRCRDALDRASRQHAMAEASDQRRWGQLVQFHRSCVQLYVAAVKDMERALLTDTKLLAAWVAAYDKLNAELLGLEKPGDRLIDWNMLHLKKRLITNIYEVYLLYVAAREGIFYGG